MGTIPRVTHEMEESHFHPVVHNRKHNDHDNGPCQEKQEEESRRVFLVHSHLELAHQRRSYLLQLNHVKVNMA
jgi:hypothetical protein